MSKKLTAKEIIKILNDSGLGVYDYVENYNLPTELGKVVTVEDVGGYEGGGELRYVVKHFVDHNVFIKTEGYYMSYDGTSFENGFGEEVIPEEKVVTVYNKKPEQKKVKTAEDLFEVLEELDISVSDFAYGEFEDDIEGIGSWLEIARKGGENQGSEWYSIKYFQDLDLYIKTEGYYQSYSGTDFEDGYGKEVRPQEKTITIYE